MAFMALVASMASLNAVSRMKLVISKRGQLGNTCRTRASGLRGLRQEGFAHLVLEHFYP